MLDLSTLNPEQARAVKNFRGPMLILAGAGTGKTRVITYRIANMLHHGVAPDSIVALSFTNKAAREMAERVRQLAGPRAKNVWLGTFHSFCLSILREFPKAAGLASRFGLAATADQLDLVRKALEEKGWVGVTPPELLHYRIGIAKNELLAPEDLRAGKGAHVLRDDLTFLAEVYELYERQLKLNRVIDFDDCIFKTVRLLRESPDVKAKLRERYRFFLVDEFQDTNNAQLAVLEELVDDAKNVCVVGDDDQSIYSWRGAVYEILERFEAAFPGTQVVKLEQNYRCSGVILNAANQVIKNNARRKDKTLWSASKETAPIVLAPQADEQEEARFVAEKIMGLLGQGKKPGDIGVLYRANAQAKPLELALREARIPYRTFGGQSFFERKEVKDFVAYLRLALNPDDRLALWRVINYPQRGLGLKTLEKIETEALRRHRSPFRVLAEGGVDLTGKPAEAARSFVEMIKRLGAMPLATPADLEALGQAILKDTGLLADVRANTENQAAREKKVENLKSLPGWLASLAEERLDETGRIDRDELLDTLTLDRDKREKEDGVRTYVSLMTIHAAKGLEFPAVFVAGIEEELLPHKNSIGDPQGVCEERRLFYVALTRAKERLYLSYCLERSGGYQKATRHPSRFLQELPTETYMRDGDEPLGLSVEARREERKQRTVSMLGKLREGLKERRF